MVLKPNATQSRLKPSKISPLVPMARFIRTAQKALLFSSSSSSYSPSTPSLLHSRTPISSFLVQSRPHSTHKITKSPFDANILRILNNEINYQCELAPPHQLATTFDSFTVQDKPGEKWMTMTRKFGDNEDIKLDVTMFDGYAIVPTPQDDAPGEDVRLHISFIVAVSKGDGSHTLEVLCSAWPDFLEIQKVYFLGREKMHGIPYLGPDFRKVNQELRKRLHEYLEARGVNDELCFFLHEYMMKKDRNELIRWFEKVKYFVEK